METTIQTRICSKCKEDKKLDEINFQRVKSFKTGFSYYCNTCNSPKKNND